MIGLYWFLRVTLLYYLLLATCYIKNFEIFGELLMWIGPKPYPFGETLLLQYIYHKGVGHTALEAKAQLYSDTSIFGK